MSCTHTSYNVTPSQDLSEHLLQEHQTRKIQEGTWGGCKVAKIDVTIPESIYEKVHLLVFLRKAI